MRCWFVLGIAPTADKAAIRAAYAKKTQTCHPEEDPEGFAELHKAYSEAMRYAREQARRAAEGLPPEPVRPGREEPQEIDPPEQTGGEYDFGGLSDPEPPADPAPEPEAGEDLFAGYRFDETAPSAGDAPPPEEPPAPPADPMRELPGQEDLFADYRVGEAPPAGGAPEPPAAEPPIGDELPDFESFARLHMGRGEPPPEGDRDGVPHTRQEMQEHLRELLARLRSEPPAPPPADENLPDDEPVPAESAPPPAEPAPDAGEYDFGDLPAGPDSLWQEQEEPTPEGFAVTREEVVRRIHYENSEAAILYPLKYGRLPDPALLIGGDRERAADWPAAVPSAPPHADPPGADPMDAEWHNEPDGGQKSGSLRVVGFATILAVIQVVFTTLNSQHGIAVSLFASVAVGLMLLGFRELLRRKSETLKLRWNAHLNRRTTRNCLALALLCIAFIVLPEDARFADGGPAFWLISAAMMAYGFAVLAHVSRRWGVPPRHEKLTWWVLRGTQAFWFYVFMAATGPGVGAAYLLLCLYAWALGAVPKRPRLLWVWAIGLAACVPCAVVFSLAPVEGYVADLSAMLLIGMPVVALIETVRRKAHRLITRK